MFQLRAPRPYRWAAVAAAAALVAACSDSTTVTSPPSRVLGNQTNDNPGSSTVCKVGPAGVYEFEIISTEGIGTILVGSPAPFGHGVRSTFSLAAGSCVDVYTRGERLELVRVNEINLPAGVTIDYITTQTKPFLDFPAGELITWRDVSGVGVEPFNKAYTITFYNQSDELPGLQGCTPGFWKNSLGSWGPTGLSPSADFDATFGVNMFSTNITLLQALSLNGGGANALARHAVAGLLAATHPDVDYALSSSDIISAVQAAAASGNYETLKNQLDAYNNQGCPLANDNSFDKK